MSDKSSKSSKRLKEIANAPDDFLSKAFFNLRLTWRLFWDGRVKLTDKLIPLGMLAYVISPFDLLPESFLGAVGLIDDFAVVELGIKFFFARAKFNSPTAYEQHLKTLQNG